MKKMILLVTTIILQACTSNALVNEASNALRYEAIIQLPRQDIIGQRAYLGGQIATIDRNKRQIELVQRTINPSGYPEQGTNNLSARIFATFAPEAQFDFGRVIVGDRVAVLGDIVDIQKTTVANNELTILQINATNYRSWTNRSMRQLDDDYYGFNSIGMRYYPRSYYYSGGGILYHHY